MTPNKTLDYIKSRPQKINNSPISPANAERYRKESLRQHEEDVRRRQEFARRGERDSR